MPEDFIIVEAPDGTEIEFPADMTDEQIAEVMRREYPPEPSKPVDEGSWYERIEELTPMQRSMLAIGEELPTAPGAGGARVPEEEEFVTSDKMPAEIALAMRALNSFALGLPSKDATFRRLIAQAGADAPIVSMVGDIIGFFGPGGLAAAGARGVAGRLGLATGGRATQAGVGVGTAIGEGALYEATTGQATRKAPLGEAPTFAAMPGEVGRFLTDPMAMGITALSGGAAGAMRRPVTQPGAEPPPAAPTAAAPEPAPTPPPAAAAPEPAPTPPPSSTIGPAPVPTAQQFLDAFLNSATFNRLADELELVGSPEEARRIHRQLFGRDPRGTTTGEITDEIGRRRRREVDVLDRDAEGRAELAARTLFDDAEAGPAPEGPTAARPEQPTAAAPEQPTAAGPQVKPLTQEELGRLLRRAATGNRAALRELVRRSETDPELARIAEARGIEMPFEALVRGERARDIFSYLRSLPATAAAAKFRTTTESMMQRVGEIFEEFGATGDLGDLSQRTLNKLQVTARDLRDKADDIFDNQIPTIAKDADINPTAIINYLEERIAAKGREGIDALDRDLQNLYNRMKAGNVTYDTLNHERRLLGEQMKSSQAKIYKTTSEVERDALYAAFREAQMQTIDMHAGPAARQLAEEAFGHLSAAHELEKLVTVGFGKDATGSIAQRIQTAISGPQGTTGAVSGNIKPLNDMLKIIPEEMHGEALLSGLLAMGRRGGGPMIRKQGTGEFIQPFAFTNFSKAMTSLNAQKSIKNEIFSKLPPGAGKMLDDLALISGQMSDAFSRSIKTGAVNAVLNQIVAENVLVKVMQSSAGQAAVGATLGAMSGPQAAAVGAAIPLVVRALAKGPTNRMDAVHDLVSTEELQNLVLDIASGPQTRRERIESVMATAEYQRWANVMGIKNPDTWLTGIIAAERAAVTERPQDYLYRTPSGPIMDAAGNTYTEEEFDIYRQERQARRQGALQ